MNQRQMRTLRILHRQNDFITLSQIAKMIGVSSKTVRNNLSTIRNELSEPDRLITRPNKGVRFLMAGDEFERLIQQTQDWEIPLDYKLQRSLAVTLLLLKKSCVTMKQIANALYLSTSSVGKAVGEADKWLNEMGVTIRRGGRKGLVLHCTEYNWRMASWKLFQILEKQTLISNSDGSFNSLENLCGKMHWFLNGFDMSPVIKLLNHFERIHGIFFSYNSRLQLIFHISVSITRYQKKKTVLVPKLLGHSYDTEYDRFLTDSLSSMICKTFGVTMPKEERIYLQYQIAAAQPKDFESCAVRQFFQLRYPKLSELTSRLIAMFSRVLNIDFAADNTLLCNFFLSLRSSVARLSQGIVIENPLLEQIQKKYPNILAAAWSVSVVLEDETGLAINENELGFLALDICGAAERIASCVHVLILCNYGISVSHLIRVRLEKEMPELVVDGVVSISDEKRVRQSDCDFIVASFPVGGKFGGKDVVQVGNFLSAGDLGSIRKKMQGVRKTKKRKSSIGNADDLFITNLFRPEFIQLNIFASNKEGLLRFLCSRMEQSGFVTAEFVDSVLDRERMTSTEVGGQVAIPHGSTKYVNRSLISVARLTKPIPWFKNDQADLIFLLAFHLSGQDRKEERLLRFYSVFTNLLDSKEKMKIVRQLKTSDEFMDFFKAAVKGEAYYL